MKTEKQNGSDQRSEPTTTAFLVNPWIRETRNIRINGYEGIRDQYGPGAELEACTLCQYSDSIYLQAWVDCNAFMVAPAWRSFFNLDLPMHGLTVIDAYDPKTGESVDCPMTNFDLDEEGDIFFIEWEDYAGRCEPSRPNKEWVDKVGGYTWSIGDGKGNVIKSGSTWEDIAQDA